MSRRPTYSRPKKARGWHAEDIKAAIRKSGLTLTGLAERNGLHESACRAALIRPQPGAEKVISAYLGVSLHELWPDRYDNEGGRVRHVRDENSHERVELHRLSRPAV